MYYFYVAKIFLWLLDLTKIKLHEMILPLIFAGINAISVTHNQDVAVAIFI